MKPVIEVVTGLTAVGKTEWALEWAERRNAEILSCDSMLFYRGMDIGTAKPTPAQRTRVRHHLIDIRDLRESMDITEFVDLARAAATDIAARGRRILVVGGSGFYLKAFFAPVADDVKVPAALRADVARLDPEHAVEELRRLNPDGLGTLDTANPRRVSRALERCLTSGRTLAALAEEFSMRPAPFADWTVRLTRLDRAAEELDRRIEARCHAMIAEGLLDEVRRLADRGLRENPSACRAIGYRECLEVLDGKLSEKDLVSALVRNTRALVKKQRTWFRTQLPAPEETLTLG